LGLCVGGVVLLPQASLVFVVDGCFDIV